MCTEQVNGAPSDTDRFEVRGERDAGVRRRPVVADALDARRQRGGVHVSTVLRVLCGMSAARRVPIS